MPDRKRFLYSATPYKGTQGETGIIAQCTKAEGAREIDRQWVTAVEQYTHMHTNTHTQVTDMPSVHHQSQSSVL